MTQFLIKYKRLIDEHIENLIASKGTDDFIQEIKRHIIKLHEFQDNELCKIKPEVKK